MDGSRRPNMFRFGPFTISTFLTTWHPSVFEFSFHFHRLHRIDEAIQGPFCTLSDRISNNYQSSLGTRKQTRRIFNFNLQVGDDKSRYLAKSESTSWRSSSETSTPPSGRPIPFKTTNRTPLRHFLHCIQIWRNAGSENSPEVGSP